MFNLDCGIPNRGETNTTMMDGDGMRTGIGEYPWQVSFASHFENDQALSFIQNLLQVGIMFDSPNITRRLECAGTLISDIHILTAARCVDWDSYPDYILLGDTMVGSKSDDANYDNKNMTTVLVTNIHYHPDTSTNIAILEMAEPVPLDKYPNIKPICLPEADTDFNGFAATVTGWAFNGVNGYNSWLQEEGVTVFDDRHCEDVSSNQLCAGASCVGDTGGPLVVSDPANNNGLTLAGIIERNTKDCSGVKAYTDVSQFIEWINDTVGQATTCPPPP